MSFESWPTPSVEYHGATMQFPWSRGSELDVWVAAYGPKALALAGQVADGFILQLADIDIARWMIGAVREAAVAAGRDPRRYGFAWLHPCMWDRTGRTCARSAAGSVGWWVITSPISWPDTAHRGDVPQTLTAYIAGRDGYDYNQHGRAGNTHAEFVSDDIVDRFCVLGTADEHIAKLSELKALGVDQFAGYLQHDNKEETLRVYGETVIPALSQHITAKSG